MLQLFNVNGSYHHPNLRLCDDQICDLGFVPHLDVMVRGGDVSFGSSGISKIQLRPKVKWCCRHLVDHESKDPLVIPQYSYGY